MGRLAHLAIDLGAESGRAMLGVVDADGVAMQEMHRFPNPICSLPSGLYWDAPGLWRQIVEALRRAAQWSAANAVELVSVGVDTWGVDFALISETGELLGLPRCYRDDRFAAACERTVSRLGEQRLYDATGTQLMPINTLFQYALLVETEPELVARAQHLVFMPDLFHYFLSGRSVVERTIASTSQMIDARTGDWARDLLGELALPTECLGEIIEPATRIAGLRAEIADDVGLGGAIDVVAPASHDTASAVVAIPASPESKWCFISSGTWSLLGVERAEPCITEDARRCPFTNELGVGGTIRFLQNITGLWLVQELRRSFAESGKAIDYSQLTDLAAQAEPFRTLIDTGDEPLLLPGRMTDKIAAMAQRSNQPAPQSPGEFVRCCLESLALTYRRTLMQMEQVLSDSFDIIHIIGGGGRNELLNQFTANATGRRVLVGPYEATALGNVFTQAMHYDLIKSVAHARSLMRTTTKLTAYEPRDHADWIAAADRFESIVADAVP